MKHFAATVDVAAEPEAIWPLLAEFRRWPEWGVSVTDVKSDADEVTAGATGRVRTAFGLWLPFVIGDVIPQSFWDWRVAGVAATGHYLEPRGAFTQVGFTVPWPAAPYGAVLGMSLRRIKRIAESG